MNIKEFKNSSYEIEAYKMKNDAIIKNNIVQPLPNNYGFAMLIVGQPNSGKTTLMLNMLKKSKKKNTYYRQFDKCYIFSNSLHTISQKINIPIHQQYNGVDELKDVITKSSNAISKFIFFSIDYRLLKYSGTGTQIIYCVPSDTYYQELKLMIDWDDITYQKVKNDMVLRKGNKIIIYHSLIELEKIICDMYGVNIKV